MRAKIKQYLNSLHMSDIYSLILFILYKVQDIPEYQVLSELCFLLDGKNMTRLLTYFAGKTITFPTKDEMVDLTSALLMYQYINIDGLSLSAAQNKLGAMSESRRNYILDLYLKILPIMKQYVINKEELQKDGN